MIKYLFIFLILAKATFASEVALFGTGCETVKDGEKRSSTTSRAADKASFDAITQINEFFELKKIQEEHDFNVFVYDIIDNNISDLIIKTTKSDITEVCVEVSGYLNLDNIDFPKISAPESIVPQELIATPDENLIYIAPTLYFDDTKSDAVSSKISQDYKDFQITTDKNDAKFIIYPKVLKAKIDSINSTTNRFHMIISVNIEDEDGKEIITEHQNKFILLETSDDEQKKAQELMLKLFKNANQSAIKKIKSITKDPFQTELINASN